MLDVLPQSMCWFCWLAVGLLPPFDELLLALLTPGKVLRVSSLLHRVPVVQHPVRWHHLAAMSHTAGRVGNCGINNFEKSIRYADRTTS